MNKTRLLSLYFLLYHVCLFSQVKSSLSYQQIRQHYDNKELNDETALPFIYKFIQKSKRSNDYRGLALGYRDAVAYSSKIDLKLKFADSTIQAALKTKNYDLISDAYVGKGIIYSHHLKKYQEALDEYLKAYNYSLRSKDEYLKHKINYHLGNVKSYLGFYAEAVGHFNSSISYFESGAKSNNHPNTLYNLKKGYYNILHQMTICFTHLNNAKKADSLVELGINLTRQHNKFQLEHAYFLKCKGILYYYQHKPNDALYYLNKALPQILRKNDSNWISIIYYYLGCIYTDNGDISMGSSYFAKVDSIFNQHQFIFPEIRCNYNFLIDQHKRKNDKTKELYYTKQLLRIDSILVKDFKDLSKKMFHDYESRKFEDEKEGLKNSRSIAVMVGVFILIITSIVLVYRHHHEKELKRKYTELQERLTVDKNEIQPEVKIMEGYTQPKKQIVSDEKAIELGRKLAVFEHKKQFLQKGLTCTKLAEQLKTNSHYLSTYINDEKGMNFNKYLAELRIRYITNLLNSDSKYLNYKIVGLAAECGIASRQNFSDLFYEINGIRPTDFIKMKQMEINKK